MHIAICDTNIAERKQLERLLSRESELRTNTTGALYVDSFGDINTLLSTPMIYDLLFLDISTNDALSFQVATSIRESGINSPIVMCTSKNNLEELDSPLTNILFLIKPVQANPLSIIISDAIAMKKHEKPTFELRGIDKTYYVKEEQILYARSIKKYSEVTLTDGTVIEMYESLYYLCSLLEKHPTLILLGTKYIVNTVYIKELSWNSLFFQNGKKLPLYLGQKKAITRYLAAKHPIS